MKSFAEYRELEEAASPAARFNQKVKQAQAAHEAGDHKKAKYHLDTARSFMLGVNSNDHDKIKDSYPKYKELRDLHKEEVELDEGFKKGDFIKTPTGEVHRVFDVKGNSLETAPYRGKNGYGGGTTVHKTKATKVPTPKDVTEEVELDENFADGKNPQDKGDSKRLGVPTKSSVSTLRKVAKEGGRKGQLAHWMANMKSGKAKMKEGVDRGEVVEETTPPSLRNPAKHRILITYSDPQHPSVSMRKEKQQKHLRVPATKKDGTTVYQGEAEDLAKRYMKKQGYKVHDTAHAGLVKEDAE